YKIDHNGNPVYDNYFRQVDRGNTGQISAGDAAQFLKKSGLSDSTLGKIWDLADSERKGYLDKRGFFIALRLVASAQGGNDISLNNLNQTLAPPKFKDTGSPLASLSPVPSTQTDSQWAIRPDEKGKFDGIFESLLPVNGLLPGDKVKPVLINSKLPLEVLGKIWEISDVDQDGQLDKEEFSVTSSVNWVVPLADRGRYDDLFLKTDTDMDGLVTGTEVIEIFMLSSLPQTMLAQIWGLADTKQMGKLSREQFSLAMYLIQQKVSQGTDPPQSLTPDMIPPSERSAPAADSNSSSGSADLTGIKELDDLSQEIAQLQRDKYVLELEIREKEEAIRQQNTEVQEMQVDLDRENGTLQDAESQKQDAKERLEEMDQQRSKLEGMLNDVKVKCQDESQTIASLQSQIRSQELDLRSQEDEMGRTKGELSRLQEEEALLGQNLLSGRVQLDSITKSLRATQDELNQARSKLTQIQDSQLEVTKGIEQYDRALTNGGSMTNLADDVLPEKENGAFRGTADSFKSRIAMFNSSNGPRDTSGDPFQTEDPFKADSFQGLSPSNPPLDAFGGDPFKATDPFKGTSSEDFFKKTDKSDLFASSDPFGRKPTPPLKVQQLSSASHALVTDAFGKTDAFGNNSFGSKGGFADFTQMSKCGVLVLGSSFRHPASLQQPPLWDPCLTSPLSPPPPPPPPLQSGSERQQMEWARRESQREEQERQRWLRRMEHEDLERAIALSKAQMPST
uniref:Epidermal growth factor receptor substrate 15-like 1 n=1 Tax=Gadus morhua TaxID=8049 RepID=A0A8C5C0W6_GADMO